MLGHLRDHVLETQLGPEVAALSMLDEALDTANTSLLVALYQTRQEMGFSDNQTTAFGAWMKDASAPVDFELATEQAEDPSVTAARRDDRLMRDVDAVVARIFPALYPSHPVNQN